jgi:hypothetical protein
MQPLAKMAAVACLLAGCSQSSSPDFSRFLGLYRLDSHALNANDCTAAGPAVAGSAPLLVVYSFFAANVGTIAIADSCNDAAACRARAAHPVPTIVTSADLEAQFKSLTSDGQGLIGEWASPDLAGTTFEIEHDVLTKTGAAIGIEVRRYAVPCQMRDGQCDAAATVAAATLDQCIELRTAAATWQEPL